MCHISSALAQLLGKSDAARNGSVSWEIAPFLCAECGRRVRAQRQSRDRIDDSVIAEARFGTTRGKVAGSGDEVSLRGRATKTR